MRLQPRENGISKRKTSCGSVADKNIVLQFFYFFPYSAQIERKIGQTGIKFYAEYDYVLRIRPGLSSETKIYRERGNIVDRWKFQKSSLLLFTFFFSSFLQTWIFNTYQLEEFMNPRATFFPLPTISVFSISFSSPPLFLKLSQNLIDKFSPKFQSKSFVNPRLSSASVPLITPS